MTNETYTRDSDKKKFKAIPFAQLKYSDFAEDIDGEQITEMKKQEFPWSIRICYPCWFKSLGVKGTKEKTYKEVEE